MSRSAISIITSAAYLGSELNTEFGNIPPSFLPIGHQRLYQRQHGILAPISERISLTLPNDFALPDWDAEWLARNKVEIVRVPKMNLGESVIFAIAALKATGSIRILHGDTLFLSPLPSDQDLIAIMPGPSRYEWGQVQTSNDSDQQSVLAGYFSFSSANELARQLALHQFDFVKSVNATAKELGSVLTPIPGWADCGYIQTYYSSKSAVSIARSFNSLQNDGIVIKKTGIDKEKICAEANWFERLPSPLKPFTPQFIDRDGESYRIAYELSPTLHELYVFGSLRRSAWLEILRACTDYLTTSSACTALPQTRPLEEMVEDKTLTRLGKWMPTAQIRWDQEFQYNGRRIPSVVRIVETCVSLIKSSEKVTAFAHGDFCFTNILYDFRYKRIKVIDPRGAFDSSDNLADLRYDLAKLRHSIEGYDLILADRYRLSNGNNHQIAFARGSHDIVREISSHLTVSGRSLTDADVTAITVTLFLSMIPLHSDRPNRQAAFFSNALRIFAEMEASL